MFDRRTFKNLWGNAVHVRGSIAALFGYGVPYAAVETFHPLPSGGANQYSYDTLALPLYTVIGNGVAAGAFDPNGAGPSSVVTQGTTLADVRGTPIEGYQTGSFNTAGLLDIRLAQKMGFVQQPVQNYALLPTQGI